MKILVVGGGNALYFLCRTFIAKGHEVTVINRRREECVRLARRLKATVIHGDASEPGILEEAEAFDAEVVLAITPNDPDNLAICQLASLRFKVPRLLALVNDPDNEPIFKALGVTAFSLSPIIASLIEQRTELDGIMNLVPVGEGKVTLTEVILQEDWPAVGKSLRNLAIPEDSLIVCIIREGRPIVPRGSSALMADDRVVLLTQPDNHGLVLKMITGGKVRRP